jgi:hypothetical protein
VNREVPVSVPASVATSGAVGRGTFSAAAADGGILFGRTDFLNDSEEDDSEEDDSEE